MITYKADFVLSVYDKTEIEVANPTGYTSSKTIYIDGLGDTVVTIEISPTDKLITIHIVSDKLARPKNISFIKYELIDVIATYKIPIQCENEENILLLNITSDKKDFKSINKFLENEFMIIKYKVANQFSGDLLNYINYLDFNYVANIILAGYIVHAYKLKHVYSPNYDNLKGAFVYKLSKVGFVIPKKTKKITTKVNEILELMKNKKEVNPYDMAFLLMNTLPNYFLAESEDIKDRRELYNSINNVFINYKGIDKI